jgi:hypothetical protein
VSQETNVTDVAKLGRRCLLQDTMEFIGIIAPMILFASSLAEVLPSLQESLRNLLGVECED